MTDAIVYVIDDDAAIRDSLGFLLASSGHHVRTYETAVAFLEAFALADRGCIVTDIRMPGMGGLDLVRELNRRGVGLPVIALTGHGDFALAVEAARAGVAAFIEKPFDGDALLAAVGAALSDDGAAARKRGSVIEQLSAHEGEVLNAMLSGEATGAIAARLAVSERVIEVYRANIVAKFGVTSVLELIPMAMRAIEDAGEGRSGAVSGGACGSFLRE